jgi:hypothetical protein
MVNGPFEFEGEFACACIGSPMVEYNGQLGYLTWTPDKTPWTNELESKLAKLCLDRPEGMNLVQWLEAIKEQAREVLSD